MEEDITPRAFHEYYKAKKLGNLRIEFPACSKCKEVRLSLRELYRLGIFYYKSNKKDSSCSVFEKNFENIEFVCVYGSILYNNFPLFKRKYLFFGSLIPTKGQKRPHDFDVLCITKDKLIDEKIIIPKRVKSWHLFNQTGVDIFHDSSIESAVKRVYTERGYTRVETYNSSDSYYEFSGYVDQEDNLPLHITYRSLDQFLNGIGRGDEVSESVVRYGIPLVGAERFYEIIKNIETPRREALHQVEWSEDKNGVLQGRIS